MTLSLIINPQPTKFTFDSAIENGEIRVLQGQDFEYDVVSMEQHDFSASITSDPIENGSPVTSHIVANPDRLTISAVISNTPLDFATRKDNPLGTRRAEKSFDILRAALKNGAEFTIVTTLQEYESMVLESLSVPRDAGRANSVEFTATFQKIIKVSAVEVSAPLVLKDKGSKPPEPADDATTEAAQSKSALQLIADAASAAGL